MARPFVTRLDRLPRGGLPARFVAGAAWAIIGSAVSRGMTLLTTIMVARILQPHTFGELGMIQSTIGLFGLFAGMGLGLTATKYVAELRDSDPARAGRVLSLATSAAMAAGGVLSMGLVVGAPRLAASTLMSPHLAAPLAWSAVWLFFSALNGVQTGALAGFERFNIVARVGVVSGMASFALTLPAVWVWGLGGAIAATCFVQVLNCVVSASALRRTCAQHGIRIHLRDGWQEWPVLVHFSLPALIGSVIVVPIAWAANLIVVNKGGGYSELALFNAADQWRAALMFLPSSVGSVVLAMLANTRSAHVASKRFIHVSMVVNAVVTGIPCIAISLGATIIMRTYGAGFAHGAPVLVLLTSTAVLTAVANVVGQVITSTMSMWWGLLLNALWAVVFMAAAVLLIPQRGAEGLALAYLIAYVFHLLVSLAFVQQRVGQVAQTSHAK